MSTLWAAGDVETTAEGNGKTRGQVSLEVVQYTTVAPPGWLNDSTFEPFPEAVRQLDLRGSRVEDVNEVQE